MLIPPESPSEGLSPHSYPVRPGTPIKDQRPESFIFHLLSTVSSTPRYSKGANHIL